MRTKHKLIIGNCLEILPKLKNESIDLIITDPPYNIGLKYRTYKDRMKKEKYLEWCKKWLIECARILKKKGSLYLINYPENNAYLIPFLDKILVFKRWLTWHYPTNCGHSKKNFTRSQRSILFYSKTKNNIFFRNRILQSYKNPDVKKVKDRIKRGKKGRAAYDVLKLMDIYEIQKGKLDVFEFNIVKNVSKYGKNKILDHPCVLPKDLIKIFIKASSRKGDVVLDPFGGTSTISVAAKELGRNSISIDIDPKYVEIGKERLRRTKFLGF